MFNLTRQEYRAIVFVTISLLIGGFITLYKQHRADFAPDLVVDRTAAIPYIAPTDSGAGHVSIRPEAPDSVHISASPSSPINLNTASAAHLQTLPGIGPALAQRIVDYRHQIGAFRSADQLLQVKGIGSVTFGRLKSQVTVERVKDEG